MIIRLIVFLAILALHVLTPSWFLNDWFRLIDRLLIALSFLCIVGYPFYKIHESYRIWSFILIINVLLYFLWTGYVDPDTDHHPEAAFWRLALIFNVESKLPIKIAGILEWIIFLQVLITLAIFFAIFFTVLRFHVRKKARRPKSQNL